MQRDSKTRRKQPKRKQIEGNDHFIVERPVVDMSVEDMLEWARQQREALA